MLSARKSLYSIESNYLSIIRILRNKHGRDSTSNKFKQNHIKDDEITSNSKC